MVLFTDLKGSYSCFLFILWFCLGISRGSRVFFRCSWVFSRVSHGFVA